LYYREGFKVVESSGMSLMTWLIIMIHNFSSYFHIVKAKLLYLLIRIKYSIVLRIHYSASNLRVD